MHKLPIHPPIHPSIHPSILFSLQFNIHRTWSSSLMMPHFEKVSTISARVTSSGRPVTYTLVFRFSSNHSALEAARACFFWAAFSFAWVW